MGPPQSLWVTGVIAAVGSAPTELVSKEAYEALRELQTKVGGLQHARRLQHCPLRYPAGGVDVWALAIPWLSLLLLSQDYFFLSSAARVALLKALADVAVMSPAFRRALQARTEDKSAMPTTPDLQASDRRCCDGGGATCMASSSGLNPCL